MEGPGLSIAPWNARFMEVIDPIADWVCFREVLTAEASAD